MIIGIFGGMSSGKTLIATKTALSYVPRKFKIFSNYKMTFTTELIDTAHIEKYASGDSELSHSCFVLDEIYLFIDSRLGGSKSSRLYSYFALQTSKRDVILIYTAQQKHSVDKRIRDNTHLEIYCFPLIRVSKRKFVDFPNSENRLIGKELNDRFYIGLVSIYHNPFMIKREVVLASEYFKYYDTTEIIKFDVSKLVSK